MSHDSTRYQLSPDAQRRVMRAELQAERSGGSPAPVDAEPAPTQAQGRIAVREGVLFSEECKTADAWATEFGGCLSREEAKELLDIAHNDEKNPYGYTRYNADQGGFKDFENMKGEYRMRWVTDENGQPQQIREFVVGEEEHAVMESWEHPYMEHLAQIATRNGGWVLEVGFGLGISGTMLQKRLAEFKDANPEKEIKHVIIEINADAIAEGERWKNGEGVWSVEQGGPGPQPYNEDIIFIHSPWQEAFEKIAAIPGFQGLDGVMYDPYCNDQSEQHTHHFLFVERIVEYLKQGAILTYCNLTSIGRIAGYYLQSENGSVQECWRKFFQETQFPFIATMGFGAIGYEIFQVDAPVECDYYAGVPHAFAPVLYK